MDRGCSGDEDRLKWRDDDEDECGVKFAERKLKGVSVRVKGNCREFEIGESFR